MFSYSIKQNNPQTTNMVPCFYYFSMIYFMYFTFAISSSSSDFSSYFACVFSSSSVSFSADPVWHPWSACSDSCWRWHMLPSLLTFLLGSFLPLLSGDFCPVSFSPTGHPLLYPGMFWVRATLVWVVMMRKERRENLESRVRGTPDPQGSPPFSPASLVCCLLDTSWSHERERTSTEKLPLSGGPRGRSSRHGLD